MMHPQHKSHRGAGDCPSLLCTLSDRKNEMPILTEEARETEFKKLAVKFYNHPTGKLNKRRSQDEGYEVFDDLEKVEIRQAGDSKHIAHYNADDVSDWREEHSNRRLTYAEVYSKQYRQFKENQPQLGEGTAIAVLPDLTPAQLSTLRAFAVHTIEALASIDGTNLKTLGMMGRELKNKAQSWLDKRSSFQNTSEIEERMRRLEDENAKLRAMHEEQMPPKERAKTGKPMESGSVTEPTPFDEWTNETIRAYLSDNGVQANVRDNKAQLVEAAMKIADQNKQANEEAA
jgi:hypothetical protein